MDIILCRANANRIAARLVDQILARTDSKLVEFAGGNMRNAIPREAEALLYVKDPAKVARVVKKVGREIFDEFRHTDPDMKILFVPTDVRKAYVKEDEARRLVNAVLACPDGVERMSQTISALGLPEGVTPYCIVPVGHPDGDNQPKDKWKADNVSYNSYGAKK